jgi:hypothetical protein
LGARQDQDGRYCVDWSDRCPDRSDRCPDRSDRCFQKGSRCSKPKKKARPSFNELLAKYKRGGAIKDRSNQPSGAKSVKATPRCKGSHHQRGNSSQYPFVGYVMPSSWYYPWYYSPTDYNSMYMNSYMIQYPVAYSNYNALQDRLFAIAIWLKIMCVLLSSKVRIATSKMLRRCSRCGVPQACPILKKGGCKDCASEEQWSNRLKRSQPSRHGPERSGDRSRRHPRLE